MVGAVQYTLLATSLWLSHFLYYKASSLNYLPYVYLLDHTVLLD